MRHLRKEYSHLASLLFLLPSLSLFAQTTGHAVQALTLSVQDRRGQFASNIQPDQIVIKGVRATVQSMEFDNTPRRILLLLDTSGSMGNYKSLSWSNVAQFAIRFAIQRKGEDSIGLDTFAEKDEVRIPFTTDSQSLVKQVEALTISGRGRTMLGLALTEIVARREGGLRFGDAIILVSDGERSDADKTNFARLRDDLIRGGIRICLVRVPASMPSGMTRGVSDVSGFIEDTGGIEFNIVPLNEIQPFDGARVQPDTLASTAQAAYAFTRTYYRIGLEVSEPLQKSRQLRLEVVDERKGTMKGLKLSYPRYLWAP